MECYSARKFAATESRVIKVLARRSASNPRAEQHLGNARSAAKPDDRGVSAWSQDQRAEGIFLYADAVGEHRQIAAITPGFGEIIIVDRGRCQTNWIGSEEPANQASQAAS